MERRKQTVTTLIGRNSPPLTASNATGSGDLIEETLVSNDLPRRSELGTKKVQHGWIHDVAFDRDVPSQANLRAYATLARHDHRVNAAETNRCSAKTTFSGKTI